ncbi:hypothetical protein TorRG33x02_337290 [Trema orientale]|uniref:Uncharacterized protein n=1 Tax=Trema orientale TaxID=63057 RepID=A0A2P5AZC6_TREOI|nr:hypothetical protein TorRG33x02_337290 [Trema orientale]
MGSQRAEKGKRKKGIWGSGCEAMGAPESAAPTAGASLEGRKAGGGSYGEKRQSFGRWKTKKRAKTTTSGRRRGRRWRRREWALFASPGLPSLTDRKWGGLGGAVMADDLVVGTECCREM